MAGSLLAAPSWAGAANLLSPAPVTAVRAAVAQAWLRTPIPAISAPAASGPSASYELPSRCLPSFGAGTTYDVCRLGDVGSRHLVVLLGDSHASMWIPAFVEAARRLGFELVPLDKPGCALWALRENRPGWPCLTWYRSVLRTISELRPSATVVSFLTANFTVAQAPFAARALQRVLADVPNGVLLADTPSDDWYTDTVPTPQQCMASAAANLGRCALHETAQMRASLARIQAMVDREGYPAIPTLQWSCADGICPTVISGTVTSEDGNHITAQYAQRLAPLLANQLGPILKSLWR